jgi:predicted Rossmann fold flavoprotein
LSASETVIIIQPQTLVQESQRERKTLANPGRVTIPTQFDLVIVGAGAAGLATAIFAARANPASRILCLDGARKIGAKILVSGGGRCNVTNVRVTPDDFCGGSRNSIRRVLNAFTEKQTAAFFRDLGVALHEEQWGKLFPDSNSAKTVLHALLAEVARLGVDVRAGYRVVDVRQDEAGFETVVEVVDQSRREHFRSPHVVLATGGMSFPKTGSDGFGYQLARGLGHSIVEPVPALAPLILEGDFHLAPSGVSHEVELTVRVESERPLRIAGPMLWTHFGASGPAMMDASRHWHRAQLAGTPARISANFLPGHDFASAEQQVFALAQRQPNALVHNALAELTPASLMEAIVATVGISPQRTVGQLTREERRRLLHAILEWPLSVTGSRGFNYAEATAGGVPLTEVDTSTMASRACPGLFLVGEILDVDGRIGGFNFQWAWSTAKVAGENIGRSRRGKAEL